MLGSLGNEIADDNGATVSPMVSGRHIAKRLHLTGIVALSLRGESLPDPNEVGQL